MKGPVRKFWQRKLSGAGARRNRPGGDSTTFWERAPPVPWKRNSTRRILAKNGRPGFISDEELWALRYKLRRELIEFARRRLGLRQSQSDFIAFDELLDPDALTIGFARRFATYKRAPLIFDQFENMSNWSTTAAGPCNSSSPARPIRATTTANATSSASFT
jgi:hypothetical protein